jgi:DNA-binding GntR family transcriptional regulator
MTDSRTALRRLDTTTSLPDLAYDALRAAIIRGRFDFGAPLRQEELAADLGVSRLPVREALRRLEAEGLVVMRPRRGYVVASFSTEEIEEVFDIRALLEERAGVLATERRTHADVRDVDACLAVLERLSDRSPVDPTAFGEANSAFHERLFQSSGRQTLRRMLRVLRTGAERYTRLSVGLATEIEQSQEEHRAIAAAFRRGDAPLTGALLRSHCENTARRLLAHLAATREETAP